MPTKDELEAQNAELKAKIAELEQVTPATEPGTANPPREPVQPDFGLSAGEVDDLRNAGVTTSPFTGKVLNALDEGIEPATPAARKRAEADRARRRGDKDRGPAPISTGDVASTTA